VQIENAGLKNHTSPKVLWPKAKLGCHDHAR
jgi:hypothetical protein